MSYGKSALIKSVRLQKETVINSIITHVRENGGKMRLKIPYSRQFYIYCNKCGIHNPTLELYTNEKDVFAIRFYDEDDNKRPFTWLTYKTDMRAYKTIIDLIERRCYEKSDSSVAKKEIEITPIKIEVKPIVSEPTEVTAQAEANSVSEKPILSIEEEVNRIILEHRKVAANTLESTFNEFKSNHITIAKLRDAVCFVADRYEKDLKALLAKSLETYIQ